MQVKVIKFGGSSLADAEQFKKVADIIHEDPARRYVVPSAPGKRFKEDTKVTDMLYACFEKAMNGEDFEADFDRIIERYEAIIAGLGLTLDMSKEYDRIKSAFAHRPGRDYAASRGEYLNGIILANYLGFDFIDAASVIFFQDNGSYDSERTNVTLSAILRNHKQAVIPGFYGSMPNGTIKTFSRGGSDITGSIVARAVNADIYENWTDVSGFLMADPRIVDNPKAIETITYRELRELSYMGATVLHEDAIFPVRFAGIPINIKNTNIPTDPGTMIVSSTSDFSSDNVITGIAGKKGLSVINIEKDMMNAEIGFGRKVLSVLEDSNIPFEHLPSGIDTMSVVVNTSCLESKRDKIIREICLKTTPDSVAIEDGLALIAIVGRGMIRSKGTAARVFKSLTNANINVRIVDQGSSELNIIIGVEEHDYENALCAIYNEFVK
ncbi:MAG: aspartate kinase [Ruminococcaceae bacterium]|nr:aspartate kinase [Oscillospiraceae bacterium]